MRKAAPFLMFFFFVLSCAALAGFITHQSLFNLLPQNAYALLDGGGGSGCTTNYNCVYAGYSLNICQNWWSPPGWSCPHWATYGCGIGGGWTPNTSCATWNAGANTTCYDYSNQLRIGWGGSNYDSCGNWIGDKWNAWCATGVAPTYIGWQYAPGTPTMILYDNSTGQYVSQGSWQNWGDSITAGAFLGSNYPLSYVHYTLQESDNWGDSASTTYNDYAISGNTYTGYGSSWPGSLPQLLPDRGGASYYFTVSAYGVAVNCGQAGPTASLSFNEWHPNPYISGISVYDNGAGINVGQNWTRPYSFTYTASVSATGGSWITWNVNETDSTGASANWSSAGTNQTSINLPQLIGAKAGVTYTYNINVHAYAWYVNTATQYFTFYTYYPANFNCNTPGNGRVIATDLALDRVVQFDSDNNNGCQSTYGIRTVLTPTTSSGSASQNTAASTYNTEPKDSIIFLPGYSNVIITSDFLSGDVWAMTWTYDKNANVTYSIDPNSIKVIQLLNGGATGGWGGITDMEFDTMAGNGQPSYFWVSSQQGILYRIPFSQINNIIQPWLNSNTYNGALWMPNYAWSSQTFINGVKVLGSTVYYNDQNTASGVREMRMYDANTGVYKGSISTGYTGASFYENGYTIAQGGNHLDGLTQSPDGHYLIASLGGGGRGLYVVDATTNTLVGLTVINPSSMPAPNANGGIDGIEMDNNWQLFLADELNGIYSIDGNQVIKAARDYGNNFYTPEFVNAQQYVSGNGGNWDDIVPLSGQGSAYQPYTPWLVTTNGNTFSDGGYSISNMHGLPLSTYGIFSGNPANTITNSNNGTGSLYSWEFQGYTSGLNHVSGSYTKTYGYDALYSNLCQSGSNTCNSINFTGQTINNTANGMAGGIYVYNNAGGTLTINADSGGIYGSGILFVNGGGNINIIGDHNNDAPASTNSLLIITKANVTIYPSSYYTNVNNTNASAPGVCPSSMGNPGSPMLCQWIYTGLVTDGNITVANYGTTPNYIQPMVLKGMMLSYGQVTNYLGMTYFNQWWPSLLVQYDPAILNNLSKYFAGVTSTQQLGL